MPTYPAPSDSVDAMVLAGGGTEAHSRAHGRHLADQENVLYYGAVGDGSTDDTTAIQTAINAVTSGSYNAQKLVFPWTASGYKFGTLSWPTRSGSNDKWLRVEVHGKLIPTATMDIPARRVHLVGMGGGVFRTFTDMPGVEIDGSNIASTDPVINLSSSSTSMYLEGLCLSGVAGTGINIAQGVCEVTMRGVSVNLATGNTSGSCIQVNGGFGYYFEKCSLQGNGSAGGLPVMNFTNDGSDPCRIIVVRDSYFGGRGLKMAVTGAISGVQGRLMVDGLLCEAVAESIFTLDSTNGELQAVSIRQVEVADSTLSPSTLIKNTGTKTYNVTVEGCESFQQLIESGSDTINNLHFIEGNSTDTTVGQITSATSFDRFGRLQLGHRFAHRPTISISDGNTAPDVSGGNIFKTANSGNTSITSLTNGADGQVITIVFTDGNTTLVNGTNIKLASATNFVSTANDTITLVSNGSTWYETARSVN